MTFPPSVASVLSGPMWAPVSGVGPPLTPFGRDIDRSAGPGRSWTPPAPVVWLVPCPLIHDALALFGVHGFLSLLVGYETNNCQAMFSYFTAVR